MALAPDVSRDEFAAVSSFLERFALNSEYALAEIRRSERERSPAAKLTTLLPAVPEMRTISLL